MPLAASKAIQPRPGTKASAQAWPAQMEARRKSLSRAGHDALGVAGLDFALDQDLQLVERPIGREGVGEVAEGVLVLLEPAIGGNVDAPIHDELAFVVARREPQ